MEQKIFNSDKSIIKMNLEFKRHYWYLRSLHNKSSIGCIDFTGFVYRYCTDSYNSFLPVCSI